MCVNLACVARRCDVERTAHACRNDASSTHAQSRVSLQLAQCHTYYYRFLAITISAGLAASTSVSVYLSVTGCFHLDLPVRIQPLAYLTKHLLAESLHLIEALRIDDVKYFPVLTFRTSSFEPIFFEKDTHESISDGGLSLFDN